MTTILNNRFHSEIDREIIVSASRVPEKSVFPSEPLDSRDRQILDLVCKHGKEGQSFNKLVEEAKPFASRSTFALRIERLQRLNYVEKLPDKERKQVKRIRGALQARMLMWLVKRIREDAAGIEELIKEKEEELAKKPRELSPQDIKAFKDLLKKTLERIAGVFSSVAAVAVTYGEAAAGDIFLPSVMESFRNVMLRLVSILKRNPELTKAVFVFKEKPPEEAIREAKAFFDEFGEEILERLPERLQSRKAALEEIVKHPEKLGLLPSAVCT